MQVQFKGARARDELKRKRNRKKTIDRSSHSGVTLMHILHGEDITVSK